MLNVNPVSISDNDSWVYFTVNRPKSHKPSTLVDPHYVLEKVK